jgi:hypothetical protein
MSETVCECAKGEFERCKKDLRNSKFWNHCYDITCPCKLLRSTRQCPLSATYFAFEEDKYFQCGCGKAYHLMMDGYKNPEIGDLPIVYIGQGGEYTNWYILDVYWRILDFQRLEHYYALQQKHQDNGDDLLYTVTYMKKRKVFGEPFHLYLLLQAVAKSRANTPWDPKIRWGEAAHHYYSLLRAKLGREPSINTLLIQSTGELSDLWTELELERYPLQPTLIATPTVFN